MANLVTATTSATQSSDFTVTSPTKIFCWPTSGSEFVGYIEEKASDGNYYPFMAPLEPGKAAVHVSLDQINSSRLIVAPGTYRFNKSATTIAIGIDTEA